MQDAAISFSMLFPFGLLSLLSGSISRSSTGIIQVNQVGIEMDSHAGASGDVNNDGLVDFIQFPIPSEYNGEPNEK